VVSSTGHRPELVKNLAGMLDLGQHDPVTLPVDQQHHTDDAHAHERERCGAARIPQHQISGFSLAHCPSPSPGP